MVRVQCPHCKRVYRTEISAFGRTAVCTKCSETFRIGDSRPPFASKPDDLSEESWIGVEPPEDREEIPHCAFCDAPLQAGEAVCPECGRHQVTGLVHKPAVPDERPDDRIPLAERVPLRRILVGVAFVAAAAGAFFLFRGLTRTALRAGDELAGDIESTTLVTQAAKVLDERGAPALAEHFSGRITDENLPQFVKMLSARVPKNREAVIRLIAVGRIRDLTPLVEAAANAETADAARAAIDGIGARRLVELSCADDERVRAAAARALCLMFDLDATQETLAALSAPTPIDEKTQRVTRLCGGWLRAIGPFRVEFGETRSEFSVMVDQVGRMFYLRLPDAYFRSRPRGPLRFDIPLDQWVRATGGAIDYATVRAALAGSIVLECKLGTTWEGTARVTARRDIVRPIAGFLPIGSMKWGESAEFPVRLVRDEQ